MHNVRVYIIGLSHSINHSLYCKKLNLGSSEIHGSTCQTKFLWNIISHHSRNQYRQLAAVKVKSRSLVWFKMPKSQNQVDKISHTEKVLSRWISQKFWVNIPKSSRRSVLNLELRQIRHHLSIILSNWAYVRKIYPYLIYFTNKQSNILQKSIEIRKNSTWICKLIKIYRWFRR